MILNYHNRCKYTYNIYSKLNIQSIILLLFADEFSYNCKGNTKGMACLFSLRNPSFPEFVLQTNSSICCIDIHPTHPHMVAVGLSDGNVAVFNLQIKNQNPSHMSNARNGKHQGWVCQVLSSMINLVCGNFNKTFPHLILLAL